MPQNRQIIRRNTVGSFPVLLRRALAAWVLAAALQFLLLPAGVRNLAGLDSLRAMSPGVGIGAAVISFVLLCLLARFRPTGKWERCILVIGVGILAVLSLVSSFSWGLLGACIVLLTAVSGFALWGWDCSPLPEIPVSKGTRYGWLVGLVSLLFFGFVSAWTVARVYSFSAPTYDFGIFAQMFHYMKTTGLPLTTLERDGLLSHFAVHVSPVYYLMLPFYALAPFPATLQILQAAVLTSAVIPAWKLAKWHGLSGPARALVCILLLLFPAYSGGTSYDIHENCFLTPLLLWLLYGIDKKSIPLTAIAAALTLTVKEDAAVYVAVVALWLTVSGLLHREKWNVRAGAAMLLGALGWFFLVTGYLSSDGEGVMTYRYKNFFYNGSSSLLTLVLAVFLNPMKAVYECVEPEKLQFLLLTLLPLLGLPLLTRRYERYILLIPYILVNLMSDYRYQHDIFYQYTFGSTALLLYLTIVNLADIRINWKKLAVLGCAAAVSTVCFCSTVLPKGLSYPRQYLQYETYYTGLRNALAQIPEDASVSATTFFTPLLCQRDILYDVRYCTREHLLETEYVALNMKSTGDYKQYNTDGQSNGFGNLVALLDENGYIPYLQYGNDLIIYRKMA